MAGRWNPFTGSSDVYRRAWWFYLLLALAALVWRGLAEESPLAGLRPTAWARDLALGAGLGAIALGLWEALRRLPWAAQLETRLRALMAGISGSEVVALALLSAFAEELFFRGALQSAVGLFPAAMVFGLAHWAPGRGGLLWAGWAASLGLALGGLVLVTGALLAPMAAHALVNAVGLWRLRLSAPSDSTAAGDGDDLDDDAGRVQ